MPVALSAKRSLGGQTGRLSENILRNGMTDNKIGGRYNGQMGGNCRFQKTAALNVRSRLHYSSGGVGSIRQRRAAAGQERLHTSLPPSSHSSIGSEQ